MARIVVGVTGASGVILAYKLIVALAELNHHIELVLSKEALYTASLELGKEFSTPSKLLEQLPEHVKKYISLHGIGDVGGAICSGSYLTDGMVVVPCSMATCAAIAHGFADNALRRAADVTIKERRPLIIVPREAPFSEIHLENMLKLSRAGATILPPMPAWYLQLQTLAEVEEAIVAKILDLLKIPHMLSRRWEGINKSSS